jgi:hypothetical protein
MKAKKHRNKNDFLFRKKAVNEHLLPFFILALKPGSYNTQGNKEIVLMSIGSKSLAQSPTAAISIIFITRQIYIFSPTFGR